MRFRIFVCALFSCAALLLPRIFHIQTSTAPPERVLRPALPPPREWSGARHLIMVAGHSVYIGASRTAEDVEREENWYLESYQKGQLKTMLSHIRRGTDLAADDNASLLVFSGGETRATAGPRSEASSYWEAANALGYFDRGTVRARSLLEVQARDSLENLLFSVARFRQASGRYPESITVVSFGFKQRRFTELHRAALRFPQSRFHYVGLDPPHLRTDVLASELSHSSKPFEFDPYGCGRSELTDKREARNPFRRGAPAAAYVSSCPEIAPLLEHCLPSYFAGPLPWSARPGDDEDVHGVAGRHPRVANSRFA